MLFYPTFQNCTNGYPLYASMLDFFAHSLLLCWECIAKLMWCSHLVIELRVHLTHTLCCAYFPLFPVD